MATTKEFHKRSDEHGGVKAGTKFKLLKDHHELQGDISAGVELALEDIVHYPTRYRLALANTFSIANRGINSFLLSDAQIK